MSLGKNEYPGPLKQIKAYDGFNVISFSLILDLVLNYVKINIDLINN